MTITLQSNPSNAINPTHSPAVQADLVALAAAVGGASGGIQVGKVTLVLGVATVSTGITITASSQIFTSMNAPGGTTGSDWKVPDAGLVVGAPGTGAFTVTAISTSGSTVTTDTSTLNYMIVN